MNPLPINLSSLLHGRSVEWERLEFKRSWNPLDVLHTVCAFANDFHNLGGGYIIIGTEENAGRPLFPAVGVQPDEIDAIQKELLKLGHNAIQPAYHPILTPYNWNDRMILVIWCPGGQVRPYKAKVSLGKDCREYAYFLRKGSSTVKARGADEAELLSLAATVPFDDRTNQRARPDDLSRDLIRKFLNEIDSKLLDKFNELSTEELCRQMQIVDGPSEMLFPRNVGLLFFNPEPQRFFPGTQIDVVAFENGPGGNRFTEKIFRGPLPQIIKESLDYIRRNFLHEIVTKHPNRPEATRVWNYPFAAIEEALVNAIYHRSYELREPVEVRITPEEITILSFPGPDRSIDLAKLRQGKAVARRYRNRRVGEFLKELDLTEGRATGIPKILHEVAANGSPTPEFETDEDRLTFLVRFFLHPDASKGYGLEFGLESEEAGLESKEPGLESGLESEGARLESEEVGLESKGARLESGLESEESGLESKSELRDRIIAVLATEPLGKKEIAERLGHKSRSQALHTTVRQLLADGQIEMTIPEKPNSRLQKYRLPTAQSKK